MNYLLVFFGGAFGSVLRFWLTQMITMRWPQMVFPIGTFCVNIIGSFLIGIFSVYFVSKWPHLSEILRVLFMVGLMGGFTTMSSFSLETVSLLYEGQILIACANVFFSIVASLLAVWLGIVVGNFLYA